jgi:RNA ligase
MKLFDYIDKNEFEACVNAGYIMVNYHPTVEGLRIICYTQTCNSDKYWNKTTVACRGLIVDKDDNIIARPFKKFFNYEEHEVCENILKPKDIDELASDWTPEVYEKLDGSLGILYWVDDVPYIATKGSFTSPQALHATEILHTKYRHIWGNFLRSKTYLFEIIYPEDLHVVTYKDVDDIFLLAIISTENYFEYPVELMKKYLPVVKKYYLSNWKE